MGNQSRPRATSGPSANPPAAQVALRLHPAAYEQVARQCKPVDVGTNTTDLQAAFVLGQQAVLAILRRDIVVEQ